MRTDGSARRKRRFRVEWAWLAVVLLVVLVGLWWVPTPTSGTPDSHSTAPRGKKFFYDLLVEEHVGPVRNVKALIPARDTTALDAYGRVTGQTLLILGPARNPDEDELRALKEWVEQGNTLIFAARLRRPMRAVDLHPFPVTVGRVASVADLKLPEWLQLPRPRAASKKDGDALDAGVPASRPGAADADHRDAAGSSDPDDPVPQAPDAAVPRGPSPDPAADKNKNQDNDEDKNPLHPPKGKRVGSRDPGVDAPWFVKAWGGGAKGKGKAIRTKLADPKQVRWLSRARVRVDATVRGAQVVVDSDRGPQAVVVPVGDGRLVVVASDEVFTNRSFVRKGQGWLLAWRLFEHRRGSGAVFVDEYLNYTGTAKTLGLLFDPLFRPITMQILLCAVLFGWMGSRRFGPPAPPANPPRRSIVEHAEALGNLQYRADAGGHAVSAYLEWWRHELHLQGGYQRQADLVARLAHLAGRAPAEIQALLHEAAHAEQVPMPAARATVLIRELSRLRQLLGRTPEERGGPPAVNDTTTTRQGTR